MTTNPGLLVEDFPEHGNLRDRGSTVGDEPVKPSLRSFNERIIMFDQHGGAGAIDAERGKKCVEAFEQKLKTVSFSGGNGIRRAEQVFPRDLSSVDAGQVERSDDFTGPAAAPDVEWR